jgi:hypothetical protein
MIRSSGINKTHNRTRSTPASLIAALATLIAAATVLVSSAESSAAGPRAHAARTLSGTATAHLHLVEPDGSKLIEEGAVTGALVGSAWAELHTGAVFKARFTIQTDAGAISGRGQATPHGSGRYQSFSGWFLATSGSGRYAHIRGRAGLYGVFDLRSDSVVIQTTDGTLSY